MAFFLLVVTFSHLFIWSLESCSFLFLMVTFVGKIKPNLLNSSKFGLSLELLKIHGLHGNLGPNRCQYLSIKCYLQTEQIIFIEGYICLFLFYSFMYFYFLSFIFVGLRYNYIYWFQVLYYFLIFIYYINWFAILSAMCAFSLSQSFVIESVELISINIVVEKLVFYLWGYY